MLTTLRSLSMTWASVMLDMRASFAGFSFGSFFVSAASACLIAASLPGAPVGCLVWTLRGLTGWPPVAGLVVCWLPEGLRVSGCCERSCRYAWPLFGAGFVALKAKPLVAGCFCGDVADFVPFCPGGEGAGREACRLRIGMVLPDCPSLL